jgi:branched-chain amino acid transport system permease protein
MSHTGGYVLQQLFNMVQLAGFYLPLAMAFAILQAVTRRIFLSFGDLAMFGSFTAVYLAFDLMLHGQRDLPTALLSFIGAIICGAAFGYALARVFLGRTLLATPLAYMIASIGFGIALQEAMRLQSMSRDIWVPPLFAQRFVVEIAGSFPVKLSMMAAVSVMLSLGVVALAALCLARGRFSRLWRATAEAPALARLSGVDTAQIAALSFALAGGLAGATGWTASIAYGGANFSIGLMAGFKAMFASVIGGFGTLRGAAAGAVVLAAMEVAWSSFFSTAYRDVAVFSMIIMVLVLKPEGVFGTMTLRESEET